MRQKIAIGILIVFCFAEIRPLLHFMDYFVNYEYISEVLCINKEKPMSTCNGKCYLSQQLKEAQEAEKKDKKIPTVEQERIPMIIDSSELPKFPEGVRTLDSINFLTERAISEVWDPKDSLIPCSLPSITGLIPIFGIVPINLVIDIN